MTAADVAAAEHLLTSGWPVQLLTSIVVVAIAYGCLRLTLHWSGSAMRRARIDTGTTILVKRGLVVVFVVLTTLFVLALLGVSSASLVTVVGAVGLAFSLAAQDILKNFFSGVYLLLERPFRVGDTIRVKEQQGVVENIGVRTTILRTPNNVQVLVPNIVVFTEVVTNHSQAQQVAPVPPADDHGGETATEQPRLTSEHS